MDPVTVNLSRSVWFFDYDGSLCPHQEVFEERQYRSEDIYSAVKKLSQKSLGVYWNTGRQWHSLKGVDSRFMEFSGYFVHGSFYWDSHSQKLDQICDSLPQAFVTKVVEEIQKWDGVRLEVKPTALRMTVSHTKKISKIRSLWKQLFKNIPSGWYSYEGPRGFEILSSEFNKGTAVEQTLIDSFAGKNPVPIAVGDDLMDRFAVEACLKYGGYAFLVGENCGWITEVKHNPKQVYFFQTPQDVLNFIENI